MSDLVSIIMPSYNTAQYIAETIQSVINQTYQNGELIIGDHCSADDTDIVIGKIKDPRIKYIKNQRNSGAAVSRNRALRMANGRWVAFLDSDDLWKPEKLEKKFREKIANISHLLESITPYEKERVEKVKERITDALEKTLSVDYDKNRLEQELIYYIEKLDVNEEKQRLGNHLKYFISTMESGSGQGKKLGFIAQEMGREINTLGSKSNHAEMQKIVVQMKDELEQIKEQVLNVM